MKVTSKGVAAEAWLEIEPLAKACDAAERALRDIDPSAPEWRASYRALQDVRTQLALKAEGIIFELDYREHKATHSRCIARVNTKIEELKRRAGAGQ